ncbi:MAG: C1 family peptidase [archaeon]|nr:C1 family peptidase [archaeon]
MSSAGACQACGGTQITGECSTGMCCKCSGGGGQKCSDGTPYGQCSSTKPKYCDNGNLIDKPSECGCPTGYADCDSTDSNGCEVNTATDNSNCGSCGNTCGANEICMSGTCQTKKCSDSTPYGQCSSTMPRYCDNGRLVDKCDDCDCPQGEDCRADGSCMQTGKCTAGTCDKNNRRYCLADETWSAPESQEYCTNCNVCGDNDCVCGETQASCIDDCGSPDEVCGDGIDNDKDGYIDESDCICYTAEDCPDGYECSNNGACVESGSGEQDCDGTPHGECSAPRYCDNGVWVDDCNKCPPCPTGKCQADGTCRQIGESPVADADHDLHAYKGARVTLYGTKSYDPDGTIVSYEWAKDGNILCTESICTRDDFSAGIHRITVTDNDNNADSDSMELTLIYPEDPSRPINALIDYPKNGQTFDTDEFVYFAGSGISKNSKNLIFMWNSSITGVLYYNRQYFEQKLFPGTNKITLTVWDGENSATDSVEINVVGDYNPPTVDLIVKPEKVKAGELIQITVTGKDDIDVCSIAAQYQGSWHTHYCAGTQTSCTHTWRVTEHEIGTYKYCGGAVDDPARPAETECANVVVEGDMAVEITSPANDDDFREMSSILFNCNVTGGTPPYTYKWLYGSEDTPSWIEMGSEQSFRKNDFTAPTDNWYQIELTVTDHKGISVRKFIYINVYGPPTAHIESPEDGASFGFKPIHFEGDAEGGKPRYSYSWETDRFPGKPFCSDWQCDIGFLSDGDHKITLKITDSLEYTAEDSVTITKTTPASLSAYIESPYEKIFEEGDNVPFYATVNPPQGTSYNYTWTSSIDKKIGNTQSFYKDDLRPGTHTITLTVDDGAGATATDSKEIIVADVTFSWKSKDGKDWMTDVRKQEQCGSCWAFSAVGAMEAVYNIEQNNPNLDEDLSEQDLVSCYEGDCDGGDLYAALQHIAAQGITDERCFPYEQPTSAVQDCSIKCTGPSSEPWKITNVGKVSNSIPAIKSALSDKGPLSVATDWDSKWWDGSVMRCKGVSKEVHAVVLVGYSDTGKYWILKNSHGRYFQNKGYFRLGYGECRLGRVTYVDGVTPP